MGDDEVIILRERVAKLEELIGLLSEVYFVQDTDRISELERELWPPGNPGMWEGKEQGWHQDAGRY